MKRIFSNQLKVQGIILSEEQFDTFFNDFKKYCKEMDFSSIKEIHDAAIEYISCQIHYGIFK